MIGEHTTPTKERGDPRRWRLPTAAGRLPRLVITDRRHRVRAVFWKGLDTYEGSELERVLALRLKEEPE